MAETYMNHAAKGRWRAFSAGSQPTGQVHPMALQTLSDAGIIYPLPASKSWAAFAEPDAPKMDLIITVCGNAADDVCPVWPGHPANDHWPFPDPAMFSGSEEDKRDHFRSVFVMIRERIDFFLS